MQLASRFASGSPVLRSHFPLSDDVIRTVAPSIFAEAPHDSRSDRYSYIPTSAVLSELRGEGFQPFMVCQTRVRHDDRARARPAEAGSTRRLRRAPGAARSARAPRPIPPGRRRCRR